MVEIRCKQCIFRNREGNEEPCVSCSEIALKTKYTKNKLKNYFKSIYTNENNTVMPEVKKRLKDRLYKLTPHSKRILIRFSIVNNETTMLTAFVLNINADICIYQITDKNSKLDENIILLDKYLFEEFNQSYKDNIRQKE
jgi:hypothetical protein